MLVMPSKLGWVTGEERQYQIPNKLSVIWRGFTHSPQLGWILQEAPQSTIAGPLRARNTKGICSGSVPTVRPFGSWRESLFSPMLKIRGEERILLYTLPYRHVGYNELKKRGPLTGHFKSPALSYNSFFFLFFSFQLFLFFLSFSFFFLLCRIYHCFLILLLILLWFWREGWRDVLFNLINSISTPPCPPPSLGLRSYLFICVYISKTSL